MQFCMKSSMTNQLDPNRLNSYYVPTTCRSIAFIERLRLTFHSTKANALSFPVVLYYTATTDRKNEMNIRIPRFSAAATSIIWSLIILLFPLVRPQRQFSNWDSNFANNNTR
uniref:Uncharacterized protein n=1 Tax=Glossina pallidipes TaxID=7398 RepID=A0A1A9Z0Q9_GLOPL